MKLTLKRIAFRDTYTIGKLYIDGKYFCDTLEDKNRDINFNGKFDNGEQKVASETCIPFGEYEITMKVQSPRFSKKEYYKKFCNGYLPRLLNVPSFDGILIHPGNTSKDSAGCILVGKNTEVGKLTSSRDMFESLYKILLQASKEEKIFIEIIK